MLLSFGRHGDSKSRAFARMMHEQHRELDAARWADLMERLGLDRNQGTFEQLQDAYAEKHRHYHTSEHIRQCLHVLDEARHLAREPDEVELALWFHDAVYATRSKRNEAKSAAWAVKFLRKNGADAPRAQRVHDLIMATKHDVAVDNPDAALVVDVDLSILGADSEAFERFERNVRKEYWWVPGDLFRKTRAAILQSFLDRGSVYMTAYFRARAEHRARRNVANAILALQEKQ